MMLKTQWSLKGVAGTSVSVDWPVGRYCPEKVSLLPPAIVLASASERLQRLCDQRVTCASVSPAAVAGGQATVADTLE